MVAVEANSNEASEGRELEEQREAWRYVFGDKHGRNAMRRLLAYCGCLPGESLAQPGTVEQLNHDAGLRSVGNFLTLLQLQFAPETYVAMERERIESKEMARRIAEANAAAAQDHEETDL